VIRHCVLVKARPDAPAGELDAVLAGLVALKDRLPGILAFVGGPDASPEGLQRGHTHAFTVDFADAAARDAYLADAGHKALGARLTAAARGGIEGITVVDFAG
jgi:hypothetical protein